MAETLVPEAITAVHARFTEVLVAAGMDEKQVTDGRPLSLDGDYLCVGWTHEDTPDIGGESKMEDNFNKSEEFDIRCEVSAFDGDADYATATARVGNMMSLCGEALREDEGLDGLLSNGGSALLTGAFLWHRETEEQGGAVVTCVFTVHIVVGWL